MINRTMAGKAMMAPNKNKTFPIKPNIGPTNEIEYFLFFTREMIFSINPNAAKK